MRQAIRRVVHRSAAAIAKPRREQTRPERALTFAYDLARHCGHQLRKDKASQVAAALTYHTLFSLLPTLVLMLVVARVFVGPSEIEQFKGWVVDTALQGLIVQDDPPPPPPPEVTPPPPEAPPPDSPPSSGGSARSSQTPADDTPRQAAAATNAPGEPLPRTEAGLTREQYDQARRELEDEIQYWLDQLETINFQSIGVVGLLLFIWGATGLLATIERSFNQIYGGSNSRPWYLRLPMYYTTLTLGPVVIIAGQVLQQRALDRIDSVGWLGPVSSLVVVLSPLVTIWLVLWLIYILLPNTRVSRRTAAIGAAVASVLWVLLITGFQVYTTRAATASLYGALALMPLTLLWMWLTWMIVLFGLEMAYALQTMPARDLAEQEQMGAEERLFDARAVVPIMAVVGEAFAKGDAATPSHVGKALGLSDRMVARVMDKLHEEKLLHRVMDPEEVYPRFTLALPPEQITVKRLLETGTRLTVSKLTAGKVPGASMVRRLNEAVAGAAGDTTLASVIAADAGADRDDDAHR